MAEKWFRKLQLVSSGMFAIGFGLNDSQKVMGIIGAALIAAHTQGLPWGIERFDQIHDWVPLSCFAAIALGTMTGGWKIVKTMGSKITKVTPLEGVAAETAGAITLYLTDFLKIPVRTTHTITGAIIGVGAVKRLSAVRWGVTRKLMVAWILTIPGIGLINAMFILTEVEDIDRFPNADKFASFIGLIPMSHSSGEKDKIGSITFRSHDYLRSAFIESAWVTIRIMPLSALPGKWQIEHSVF